MGKSINKVTVRAWLLAALVLFPYAAQTVHVELHCAGSAAFGQCSHHDGDHDDEQHDPATCPVCRFHLAPYIRTDTILIACYEVEYRHRTPRPRLAEYGSPLIHVNPRGPPA
ncbi:MAG: hypothetical protein LUE26_10555 [Alistipes sp.]|nr:hypothetical protein [Alistipes sp.]